VNLPIQEVFIRRDFRTRTSADSRISQTSNFVILQVHDFGSFAGPRLQIFASPQLRSFAGSRFRIFASSRFLSFAGSRFQILAGSRFLSFAGPGLQISASSRLRSFAGSRFLKTHFTNFIKLDVSRVTDFPEFPNTEHFLCHVFIVSWIFLAKDRIYSGL
jgi:hypothetical protein